MKNKIIQILILIRKLIYFVVLLIDSDDYYTNFPKQKLNRVISKELPLQIMPVQRMLIDQDSFGIGARVTLWS